MAELDRLVAEGALRPVGPSGKAARRGLDRARRSLATAARLVAEDPDWAYAIAYDAVLQATLGLMHAMGYRTSRREGAHRAAVRFAEIVLGGVAELDLGLFEKMRRDRNRVVYEAAGSITERQATRAAQFAERYVALVEERLAAMGDLAP